MGSEPTDSQVGTLKGYACYNRSRRAFGKGHVVLEVLVGLGLTFVGIVTIPILVGLLMAPLGVAMLCSAWRNAKAMHTLRKNLESVTWDGTASC